MFSLKPQIGALSSFLRKILSIFLGVVVALPAVAADTDTTPTAMANIYGTVWINGSVAPSHSPLFPGDQLQTGESSSVRISSSGSSLTVQPDSAAQFESGALVVETGTASIGTAVRMSARAGGIQVVPVSSAWTAYQLTNTNGSVEIVALKGDLQLTDGQQTDTLNEGQQATEDSASPTTVQKPHRPTHGKFIKKKYVIYAAIAGGTAAAIWAIVDATSGSPPASPTTP
jgi:hypothetical protein